MSATVVKLGSSIVADDAGEIRTTVLHSVCGPVARMHHAGDDVVLVTSGAIARGMRLLGLRLPAAGGGARPRSMDELQAASAVGQGKLYRFYDELLRDQGVPSAQVLLTDTDGLHTADPRSRPSAPLVGEVTDFESLSELQIGHATSPLGSGGMRSKVVAAEMATAAGIETVIANGLDQETVAAAIDGRRAGTRFPPRTARYSSFKLWLKYAKPSHGRVVVDAGAARAL